MGKWFSRWTITALIFSIVIVCIGFSIRNYQVSLIVSGVIFVGAGLLLGFLQWLFPFSSAPTPPSGREILFGILSIVLALIVASGIVVQPVLSKSFSNTAQASIHTPTAKATQQTLFSSTPTPSPDLQPTSPPTATPQETTILSYAQSYYVCGDNVKLTNLNAWHTVTAGTVVHTSDYSGPVNSYTGPSGNPKNSPGNCSGTYQWAWGQDSVQAQWTWSHAYLPAGSCYVSVHIPSWYAGAEARYTLTVTTDAGSTTNYTFDQQSQDQPVTVWLDLLINGRVPSISLPKSADSTYTLVLSLQSGGSSNLYLGADAIRFNCDTSAS